MEINGTKIRVFIRLTPHKEPLLCTATLIIDEWMEIKGFRIRTTEFNTRLGNIWVTPPAMPPFWKPLFSTTAAGKDKESRDEARRNLWYQLEDLIYSSYLEKKNEDVKENDEVTEEDIEYLVREIT